MEDEVHEVVTLLLARMESHPEEFRVGKKPFNDRWDEHVSDIQAFGNEADTAALNAKLRDIRLGEIHERVMDELLNGEDRRRKDEEEREYERNMTRTMQQSSYAQANNLLNQYGQLNGLVGVGTQSPTTKLDVGLASQSPTPSGPLNSIKKALGI